MSRRSGQDSKPFPSGKWWRVRARFDVPGVGKRQQRSLKVCLVSQRLPMPVIERMAREVIAASGANSEERFNRIVLGEGATFMEQANIYLQEATTQSQADPRPNVYRRGFEEMDQPDDRRSASQYGGQP